MNMSIIQNFLKKDVENHITNNPSLQALMVVLFVVTTLAILGIILVTCAVVSGTVLVAPGVVAVVILSLLAAGALFCFISLCLKKSWLVTLLEISAPEEILIPILKDNYLSEVLQQNLSGIALLDLINKTSLEEAESLQAIPTQNISCEEEKRNLEPILKKYLKDQVAKNIFVSYYSPVADGNCLFHAFRHAALAEGVFTPETCPSVEQLREESVEFLKNCLLSDNVCLLNVLNDLLAVLNEESCSTDCRKIEALTEKFSQLFSTLLDQVLSIQVPSCGISTVLNCSRNTHVMSGEFLKNFLDLFLQNGVYASPSLIDALAKRYGITIFFYQDPPLYRSEEVLKGAAFQNKEISLYFTQKQTLGCLGESWNRGITAYNSEAQTPKPIRLGLLLNHFYVLNMEAIDPSH